MSGKWTSKDIKETSERALTGEDTVRRYALDEIVKPVTARRIEKALRELGREDLIRQAPASAAA